METSRLLVTKIGINCNYQTSLFLGFLTLEANSSPITLSHKVKLKNVDRNKVYLIHFLSPCILNQDLALTLEQGSITRERVQ